MKTLTASLIFRVSCLTVSLAACSAPTEEAESDGAGQAVHAVAAPGLEAFDKKYKGATLTLTDEVGFNPGQQLSWTLYTYRYNVDSNLAHDFADQIKCQLQLVDIPSATAQVEDKDTSYVM